MSHPSRQLPRWGGGGGCFLLPQSTWHATSRGRLPSPRLPITDRSPGRRHTLVSSHARTDQASLGNSGASGARQGQVWVSRSCGDMGRGRLWRRKALPGRGSPAMLQPGPEPCPGAISRSPAVTSLLLGLYPP